MDGDGQTRRDYPDGCHSQVVIYMLPGGRVEYTYEDICYLIEQYGPQPFEPRVEVRTEWAAN